MTVALGNRRKTVKELNKKSPNFVDVYHNVWDGNVKWENKAGFLKTVKVEYHGCLSGRKSDGTLKFVIDKDIHVTGQNFGFTVNADEAEVLSQLLSAAAKEYRENRESTI